MLLVGANCITEDEEKTQMAIWSISASPLIMGNDLRNVSEASKAILLNLDAIAVSQDPLGQMGTRVTSESTPQQVWSRNLANGDVAVALYNTGEQAPILPPFENTSCATEKWTKTTDGYYEACGGTSGDIGEFSGLTVKQAQNACCANPKCAGFSFESGGGFYKDNANCGVTKSGGYEGYTRTSAIPNSNTGPADITVNFSDPQINLFGKIDVYDIWEQKTVGTFEGSYTAKSVPSHGTAFVRLSKSQ